jgi:hypothetical protein
MSFKKPFKAVPIKPTEQYQRVREEQRAEEQRRSSLTRWILVVIGLGAGIAIGLKITGWIE